MSVCFLQAFLAVATTAAGALPAVWHIENSPHFEIYYESKRPPDSIALELERLHGKLRVSVSMFAPWMAKEKTRIYIYKDQGSYLRGEFNPPRWSKGLAFFSKKTVVLFDSGDPDGLRAVAAHELTHLYFEDFYREYRKSPPGWLNEGLAVLIEDMSGPGPGPWTRALKYAPKEKLIPLDAFFKLRGDESGSDERMDYWYLESFGVVSYLFNPRTRLQFMSFCVLLRKGEPLAAALWKVYRLNGPAAMESPWRQWLRARANADAGGFSAYPPGGFNFNQVKLSPFTFKSFGYGRARR